MTIKKEKFGQVESEFVHKYTLTNHHGMQVVFLDYGCVITDILVPDREGQLENVVLGYDSLDEYRKNPGYFGAIIGRVAGRIAGSEFILNDQTYKLPKNEGENHLHGGQSGFDSKIWKASYDDNGLKITFSYLSEDHQEGYPGNLHVSVTYELTENNELKLTYVANSDQDTLLNMTNHTYFNLSGNYKEDVSNHWLKMNSPYFLPLKNDLIPTGEIQNVEGTPFDFTNGQFLKEGFQSDHSQITLAGGGYDHPFVLSKGDIFLKDEKSGRCLQVVTDQKAVVIYTSNQLDSSVSIRHTEGKPYLGICLETQAHPDAIHHQNFPSIVLKKEDTYQVETTWSFSVES
ncbi:aldose 1-epimerase [Bacillus sp. TS-2]|nr:aldose 1-epimerase [Bacillus sp. TS-2]